jgi:hypothetical protein
MYFWGSPKIPIKWAKVCLDLHATNYFLYFYYNCSILLIKMFQFTLEDCNYPCWDQFHNKNKRPSSDGVWLDGMLPLLADT